MNKIILFVLLGLRDSDFGIIMLSKNFFMKRWPMEEQQALVNKQMLTRERKTSIQYPICPDQWRIKL
jgi:hypothetical protein